MDHDPSNWMRDRVEEWERHQMNLEAMRTKTRAKEEETLPQQTREFLKNEVDIFKAQIGARIEQDQKMQSRQQKEKAPAEITPKFFMGEEVETFKAEVAKTLFDNHKKTCSTCNSAVKADPVLDTHETSVEFMKKEVEEFKKNMKM